MGVLWGKALISEKATFEEAFRNLNEVGIKLCICISEDDALVGLITDGDLRRTLRDHKPERWATLQAKDLMTADPITVSAELMAVDAIQRMEHNRRKPISVLPVVNAAGELDGLLRLHDLVQAGLA